MGSSGSISTPTSGRPKSATGLRAWFFRGLVVIAAGLMVVSWVLPWWSADVLPENGWDALRIYPYGLVHDMGETGTVFAQSAEMPGWWAPLVWAYLAVCLAALLVSMLVGERSTKVGRFEFKWASLLIGCVGLSYVVAAIVAYIYAQMRVTSYGVAFLGRTVYSYTPYIEVSASLDPAYWLAWGAGLLLVALALFRERLVS